MKQQNIWSVHMTSIGKENRSREGRGGGGGGGTITSSRKDWAELYGVYKIGLKRPVFAMAITRKPQSLSVSERDRELELEL